MKQFIIKNFALSYATTLFGNVGWHPRASNITITSFAIAVIYSLLAEPMSGLEYLVWLPFTICILLGFRVIKGKLVNYGAIIMFLLVTIFANVWTALPLLFFIIGIFFKKTEYLFYTVKYDELEDWEQKYQYLNKPSNIGLGDETFPSGILYERELKKYSEMFNDKYRSGEKFVNAHRIIYPFAVILGLLVFAIVLSFFK